MFDVILIGSGPCAVAALDAIDRNQRIAVVTGESCERFSPKLLHPKIQAVSVERGTHAGVAEPVMPDLVGAKPLFATAIIGGLANYWGQQVLRYGPADPLDASVFPNHAAYLQDCAAIERLFQLRGGETLARAAGLAGDCEIRLPRLLTGTASAPDIGLNAMNTAFMAQHGTTHFQSRAHALAPHGSRWQVHLESGETISAARIVIAAGVMGTARLLMASFPQFTAAEFADHTPYMIYATGLSHLRRLRPRNAARHFNALTIENVSNGRSQMFASLYDMGEAEWNLLLASTIGRAFAFLRGWPTLPFGLLIQPVQTWTPQTFGTVRIDATTLAVTSRQSGTQDDPTLADIKAMIAAMGGRALSASQTTPGYGFHYHALKLAFGGAMLGVAEALRAVSGSALQCVDASVLPEIGLRPHTLTAMATARRLVLQHQTANAT